MTSEIRLFKDDKMNIAAGCTGTSHRADGRMGEEMRGRYKLMGFCAMWRDGEEVHKKLVAAVIFRIMPALLRFSPILFLLALACKGGVQVI